MKGKHSITITASQISEKNYSPGSVDGWMDERESRF
jgi:hypothetical protein